MLNYFAEYNDKNKFNGDIFIFTLKEVKIIPGSICRKDKIMNNSYLSDVIDYQRDIEPYRIIQIYAGVGSGKNRWVEQLAKQGLNILLITSRKATADAQAKKLGGSRWIHLDELVKNEFSDSAQRKVIVTNAGIEKFLKTKYDPEDVSTHIWKYFDLIILDEAHSLIADATFSDSPFHVKSFFTAVYNRAENSKLIFMTGTNESIQNLFKKEIKESQEYNFIDLYKQSRHVDPSEVYLYSCNHIEHYLTKAVKNGERIIYFANSITRMEKMVKALCKLGLKEENIGIAYADTSPRKFSKSLRDKKTQIRDMLREEERLPQEIKIFLTTSQNKEGININDENIKYMVSEASGRSALIQMAGRVRKGLKRLIVLYDAEQHGALVSDKEVDLDFCCLDTVKKYEEKQRFVGMVDKETVTIIENKFPTIRYNYIAQKCEYYNDRKRGYEQQKKDRDELFNIVRQWDGGGKENFQKWFPYSKISLYTALALDEEMNKLKADLNKLIDTGEYLDRELSTKERDKFKDEINCLLKSKPYSFKKLGISQQIRSLNPFLKKFNYVIRDASGHRNGNFFILQRITNQKDK